MMGVSFFLVLLSLHTFQTLSNANSTLQARTTDINTRQDLGFPLVTFSAPPLFETSNKTITNQETTVTNEPSEDTGEVNDKTTSPLESIDISTLGYVNRSSNRTNTGDNSAYTSSFDRMFHDLQYIQDVYGIPCLSPIGIIGNGLVASILLKKDVANSGKRYLVFILLSDILGLFSDLFLPLSRFLAQQESWNMKVIAAKMYFWNSDGLSFFFRRFNLNVFTVLSFERLIAIRKPLELKMSYTVTHFPVCIILCVLYSTVQTLSVVLVVHMVPIYDQITDYTTFAVITRFGLNKTQLVAMFVFKLIDGPLQIITFSFVNLMIIWHLAKRHTSSALSSNKDRAKHAANQQMKLLKVFLILSLTNVLAFLPQCGAILYSTYMHTGGGMTMEPIVHLLVSGTHLLRVLNSVTDFIVFVAMSKEVRWEMRAKFFCCKRSPDETDGSMQQHDKIESSETQNTSLNSI